MHAGALIRLYGRADSQEFVAKTPFRPLKLRISSRLSVPFASPGAMLRGYNDDSDAIAPGETPWTMLRSCEMSS